MVAALWTVVALIAFAIAALVAYWLITQFIPSTESHKKISPQGVVKHDWFPTGRIDFATRLDAGTEQSKDQPDEFKLLVEERRIVESIAGNENLEIQWRLATLNEAKAVVAQYNKYLSENSLIKSISELSASSRSAIAPEVDSSAEGQLDKALPKHYGSGTGSVSG